MTFSEQVLLVVPPVLYPGIPTLGPSVLVPALRRAGLSARVHYANLAFAARFGFDLCARIAGSRTLIGEAIFLGAAFPEKAEALERILALLRQDAEADAKLRQLVRPAAPEDEEVARVVAAIPDFIAETARRLVAGAPRIVGFSTMVQQTMASIALAREVKRLRPDIVTVLGGANAAEPIGSALIELTGVFDAVFSGESDIEFPRFCRRLVDEGTLPATRIIRGRGIPRLDDVPAPDYDDYFAELAPLKATDPVAATAPHFLIFESSRGCWWGDKKTCTFCGYNFPGTQYRAKSPERVVSELEGLIGRYGVGKFYASDNIMAKDFPKGVLDALAERGTPCALSYEVKSPIRPEDLDRFVRAGIFEIQPGIESFSTRILKSMDKGVSGIDNIRVLRDATTRSLRVIWNILTAIPGETRADYEEMLPLLPLLEHLRPPTRWGPIRISRYSPYHNEPERFGITGLRAWQAYYELYGDYAERIALHFFGEYRTEFMDAPDLVAALDRQVQAWTEAWAAPGGPPRLSLQRLGGGWLQVTDTRRCAKVGACLLAPDLARVLDSVQMPVSEPRVPEADRERLGHLVSLGFVLRHEQRYVSLVTEPALGEALIAEREQSLARRAAAESPASPLPAFSLGALRVGTERPVLVPEHGETLRL
ncbi:Radical SAM domain protein [Methylobacterium sp. 4-46]|uniref:RiPP maturation radical SAM C-methyltransferase n=1 Tax=unclassified Methylobacterium TaxID=2615210 RepID=UPI000152DB42|nr:MULTISPECIES: RiPP maturation radical SAM C-methyltransferase [Methylobacterium]ACA14680.1 Radical SAM domain protein [Methylobacterium sp. 4-46]WFT80433.1 RiPP maturation radical SAM C-methyltransferase [Methylobacterium nodulans]